MEETIAHFIVLSCKSVGDQAVSGAVARRMIQSLLKDGRSTCDDLRKVFLNPDEALGAFRDLPESFRAALARSAQFHIQEEKLLTSSITRALGYGLFSAIGGSLVHAGWKLKGGRLDAVHDRVISLGRRVMGWSRTAGQMWIRWARFTRCYRAPFPHMLWMFAGVDPWPLIQDYIEEIPVDTRLSTVLKSSQSKTASCGLIGFDLLRSRGKLFFLESNFNPGHYYDRHLLSPEGDTVCRHLTEWAAQNGYTRIVVFPHSCEALFERNMEEAWHEIAKKRGLALELVDDPKIGSPWPRSRSVLMDCRHPGTVFVNGRYLPGPLSRLVAEKGLLDAEISAFNRRVGDERAIPIPRLVLGDADIPATDDSAPFPNIIVKNSSEDQAKGILLYKTRTLPPAATVSPNIAYEFVVPDLEVEKEHGEERRFVSIFRTYLLITPDGPVYLGARKDVSSATIPATLPYGRVQDTSRYITNLYLGAHSVRHSEEEDRACRDATLAIGMVIHDFIKKKHRLAVN